MLARLLTALLLTSMIAVPILAQDEEMGEERMESEPMVDVQPSEAPEAATPVPIVVPTPLPTAVATETANPTAVIPPTVPPPVSERVVEVDQSHSQYGLTLTLRRIVFGDFETRAYVTARNGGSSEARCVPCGVVIVQGDRQFNEVARGRRELPRLPTTMQRGVSADSVYYFDRIEPVGTLRFMWDGPYVSDFWRESRPFLWSVYLSG